MRHASSRKKRTHLNVAPGKLNSNWQLNSDKGESENDEDSDPSDFDEDESDVSNDLHFKKVMMKMMMKMWILQNTYSCSVKYCIGQLISKDWV